MNTGNSFGKMFRSSLKMLHLLSAVSITGGFLCMLITLLTRNRSAFTGSEVIYDKINLNLFNTAIIYGAILMIITIFIYSTMTEWGFLKFRFLIIKWILLAAICGVAWFGVGSAISGMASISDAGLHMGEMAAQYNAYWNQSVICLSIELVLLVLTIFISIKKPFGKRNTKPFKYRKVVIACLVPCMILGIGMMIMSEVRHISLRNTPIADIDVQEIADGEYEGESTFGSYTYHVRVTVAGNKIIKIEDLAPRESIYVTYASGVFNKIIDQQTPDVDAITGATTTSKAFMKAVEDALDGEEK